MVDVRRIRSSRVIYLGKAFDLHGEGVVAVPKNVLGVCGCCDGEVA